MAARSLSFSGPCRPIDRRARMGINGIQVTGLLGPGASFATIPIARIAPDPRRGGLALPPSAPGLLRRHEEMEDRMA